MPIEQRISYLIYGAIVVLAVGHIYVLWPYLEKRDRVRLCVSYGIGIVAMSIIVLSFLSHTH